MGWCRIGLGFNGIEEGGQYGSDPGRVWAFLLIFCSLHNITFEFRHFLLIFGNSILDATNVI